MMRTSVSIGAILLFSSFAYAASGGMISGTINDPAGAPMKAVFVQAQNSKTRITVTVLSDKQGHYRIENLSPGEYQIQPLAIGHRSEPRTGLKIDEGQSVSQDFRMQKRPVRWSELTNYQGVVLLPDGKGKTELVERCFACHGFQTRMAATRRDEAGWRRAVAFMADDFYYFLGGRFTREMARDVGDYLIGVFGEDSELPRSPQDLPAYANTVRTFSDEALNIVYVDYELPGPNRFPWSGAQDKDGNIWIPYYGKANRVGKLNPTTGVVEEFRVPNVGTAAIHSAVPAPDGTVWFSEQGPNKVGKLDVRTQKITEYQAARKPEYPNTTEGGSKHTIRVDLQGNVWATGGPLSRFGPKTEEFTEFPEVPSSYGIIVDKQGSVWFTEFREDGKLGKFDAKTGKITKWATPTPKAFPRRIAIDAAGMVWVAEYRSGKIARFDPKTETFKEYPLPGPSPTPYALGIDRNGYVWFSSMDNDYFARLDPKTGAVLQFPVPYAEMGSREFTLDSQGRMWFASPPNNKVGYFTIR